MSNRSLANRWRDQSGARLAAQVLDRLVGGEPLDALPLGRHAGRLDLRGFSIPDPEVLATGVVAEERVGGESAVAQARWLGGLVELRGVTMANVDLSGGHLEHLRLFDTTLRNCHFEKAKCRDLRAWNLTVEECSFRNANLRDSALGTWYEGEGNRFRRVDFSGADLRGIACQGAYFEDCDFSGARLQQVEFGGCEFVRCRFAGVLEEVRFLAAPTIGVDKAEPGRLEDVDLSAATLRWVDFQGVALDTVKLPPEGGEHVIVRHFPCVVRRALERLGNDHAAGTRKLRSRLSAEADQLDEARGIGIWHRDELGETPEQQRFARDLLHEVERECAGHS